MESVATGIEAEELADALFRAEDDLLALGCREEPLPFGRLLLDERHPAIYDTNGIRDVRGAFRLEDLEAAFERLAVVGCRHRRVAARETDAVRRLDQLLMPRSYGRQVCLAMAHLGATPSHEVPRGIELVLLDDDDRALFAALAHCQDLVRREEPWYSPEISRQMDELCRRQVRLGGAELLAALDTTSGQVLASLMMREADGVAFVCDVGTVPSERRRGLASALVSAAVALSRSRGVSLVGLTARRDDAPRRLYERLGFVSVGESVDFVRGV